MLLRLHPLECPNFAAQCTPDSTLNPVTNGRPWGLVADATASGHPAYPHRWAIYERPPAAASAEAAIAQQQCVS